MAALHAIFILLGVVVSQAFGASFSDLANRARPCNTFEDCDTNECCVVIRNNGILGKRQLQGVTGGPIDEERNTGRPIVDNNANIIELLRKLAELQKEKNKPDPELGKLLTKLGQDSSIKSFLDSYPGVNSSKKGVCRRLSEEGERCLNYLNGPQCPCGDNLDCRVDKDHKFDGFGAISGIHDLKCFPI